MTNEQRLRLNIPFEEALKRLASVDKKEIKEETDKENTGKEKKT